MCFFRNQADSHSMVAGFQFPHSHGVRRIDVKVPGARVLIPAPHTECDYTIIPFSLKRSFQFPHPRRVRLAFSRSFMTALIISIPAPAWGATFIVDPLKGATVFQFPHLCGMRLYCADKAGNLMLAQRMLNLSILAPTPGATQQPLPFRETLLVFQFPHPIRSATKERRITSEHSRFNSRTRTECDLNMFGG